MRSIGLASALALNAALPAMAVAGGPPPDLQLNTLSVGVSIPLGLRHAGDGSGRVFMIQRAGQIRVLPKGLRDIALPSHVALRAT